MKPLSADDFEWDDVFWTTTRLLPSWKGFGAKCSKKPSSGKIEIVFAPEGRDDAPLGAQEISLVQWAVEHEAEMQPPLLAAVFAKYPAWRKQWLDDLPDPSAMPALRAARDLEPLVKLQSLNVHQVSKKKLPYVGFSLHCTWDDEHGLGVLMHGTRVVRVGGADTAILLWMAEEDAKKR